MGCKGRVDEFDTGGQRTDVRSCVCDEGLLLVEPG